MRLSEEKSRQLSRLVWRDRIRRAAPLVVAVVVILGVVAYVTDVQISHVDRTVELKEHTATVLAVTHGGARGAAVVQVHLDDGRDVDAVSVLRVTPNAGAHVVVNEAKHASGRLSFDVARATD
jgi:ABC-type cobalamin transport system permease subunit